MSDATCPTCCFHGAREDFEGYELNDAGKVAFVARCPLCEALHPDQRDSDPDWTLAALAQLELEQARDA